MPIAGGKYTPGNAPGPYQHTLVPGNIKLGGNKPQQLPPTLPPQGKPVMPLRGGAEYAIADPKNPHEPPAVPKVAKAPRVIPPGSERTWPGGGTGGLVDRLCAMTKECLGITKSYKIK